MNAPLCTVRSSPTGHRHANASHPSPPRARPAGPFDRFVADLVRRLAPASLRRATTRTLHSLDDRTLHDLGLHRWEIGGLAAEIDGRADSPTPRPAGPPPARLSPSHHHHHESTSMHAAIEPRPPLPDPGIDRYARCIEASKRIRWDIDRDVIRGRSFDFGKKFLPDGLSKVDELAFLQPAERALLSQVQGRTYANMFGLVERFIGAKTLELSRDHCARRPGRARGPGAPHRRGAEAPGAVPPPRADDRRGMPRATASLPQPDDVAGAVLGKSTWAVLALTLDIELFTQAHYRSSIEPDDEPLRAVEGRVPVPLEGRVAARDPRRAGVAPRATRACTAAERDRGVDDLIELVGAVDGICQMQARPTPTTSSSTCAAPSVRPRRRVHATSCSRPTAGNTSSPARRNRASSRC